MIELQQALYAAAETVDVWRNAAIVILALIVMGCLLLWAEAQS